MLHRQPFEAREKTVRIIKIGGPGETESQPGEEYIGIEFHTEIQFSVFIVGGCFLISLLRHINLRFLAFKGECGAIADGNAVAAQPSVGNGTDIQRRADFRQGHPTGQLG